MDEHKLKTLKDSDHIIMITDGEGTTFDKLKDCYFYPAPDVDEVYVLYSKHNKILAVVANEQPFMFEHDGLIWKVPDPREGSEKFKIDGQKVKGSFWNNDKRKLATDDTGTFSGQNSGGSGGDMDAAYAAAK